MTLELSLDNALHCNDTTDERHDEDRLVRAVLEGDERAYGELYMRLAPRVRRLLVSTMGPTDELDDLVQEVFLRGFRALKGFRGEAAFSTWLQRIAVRTAYDHIKKKSRRRREISDHTVGEQIDPESCSAADRLFGRELVRRFYAALEELSPKRRVALTLFEIEGRTIVEAAELMGVAPAVAKSRIWFARRELRKRAADDPYLSQLLEELTS